MSTQEHMITGRPSRQTPVQDEPPPEKSAHAIVIRHFDNGWMVEVGCKKFVFRQSDKVVMLDLIGQYLVDSFSVMEDYHADKISCLRPPR